MPGSGSETATSQYPTHIHFRKDWVHGDWTTLPAGANSVSDAFNLICQNCSIVDSQTSQNLRPSAEGHSVLMQGTQFKVDHNWFEGQSIGIFTGGTCSPWPVAGYVPFQDVEERRNRFTFPFTWLGTTIPGGNAHWPGYSIERKNTNELKSGQRVLRTGNIMENSDASGGQGGTLGDVKTSNDSCGFGTNYQNIVTDVTDVSNIWRNSCEGIETIRNPGDVGGVDFGTRRWEIQNSLFYNTSETNFGCSENEGIQIDAVGWAWQGTLTENSNGTATFVANCSVNSGGCIGQVASATVSGCSAAGTLTFSAPSIIGGTKAAGSFNASCVATISNPGAGYTSAPTVTATSGTATATINASSTTPGTGFTVLDMLPEDPAAVTQCNSVTSFNQPTASYSSGYLPSGIGPPVAAGVNPASLTTTYAWPTSTTPFGSVDSSGYCKLTNMQSFPQAFVWDHNTAIMDSTYGLSQGNGFGNSVVNGPNFEQNTLLRDSIFLGGGWRNSSGIASGTATEKFNYDITSMSVDHLVWPTQTASTYTEYGNNASYPDSAGCTGAGCSPPTTMYFPTTPYCTGSTSTSACIGFLGAMSASSMPLTLTDYHQYALRSDSSFFAGAADDASDGTSMGVNMSTIDSAQTQNLFACTSSCGSAGPFPDFVAGGGTVATPTFSPMAGTYPSPQSVTISTSTAGATKCYTADGTNPTANGAGTCTHGTTYSSPVSVAGTETLKAIGSKSGDTDSLVGTAGYILQGSAPTFSPASYTGPATQTVTISQAQSLAMCYTTNGATPASNGSGVCASPAILYSGPLTVGVTETVKAIGMASGWTDSSVGLATYTITTSGTPGITFTGVILKSITVVP
jgi:hypothetical protein